MSPQEILTLCSDLGVVIRVENDNLVVSPPERLPASLREQLREQKETILTLLAPASFENPRSALKRVEKLAGVDQPAPEPIFVVFDESLGEGAHTHTEADITAALRRIWAEQQLHSQGTNAKEGLVFVSVDGSSCDACRGGPR